ncbi:hypothetical protein Egran_00110 [Elaphomyces granulatus]|uniref:Major facilitator superfamily (MFS) profile domain-containing protein n=1 Tax=Elaphomyces granulatus TaxID=519963 RepID=A0A232M6V5_9EURO|nr:hypothetical protein Egran_00110 [Elaphomyces granulatus]
METIREAPFGQILRWMTGNRVLQYPEEHPDFVFPTTYLDEKQKVPVEEKLEEDKADEEKSSSPSPPEPHEGGIHDGIEASRYDTRANTAPFSHERFEIEAETAVERTLSRPIEPQRTKDGMILVDWYSTDDAANPQNWSLRKKTFAAVQICLYTFVVYCGSAIYVPSEGQIMEEFNVGDTKASLGLALYVVAYGIGPLLWSPLSEVPAFGRNVPYMISFFLFVILSIPTALVKNLGGFLVLRFLQGFFGSPCLANGGASLQDLYSLIYVPIALTAWVSAAYCGPALGPLISAFAVTAKGWRWALWEILWMSAPIFVVMFFFLPETSAENVLLRRAHRLRKVTGNSKIRSQSEINRKGIKFGKVLLDALIKPLEIMVKDPAVLFTNIYTSLIYGIYYSFFEVFPLVYPPIYGFSLGLTGTTFICIIVACLLGVSLYVGYLLIYLIPDIMKNGLRAQEHRLVPALFAIFFPTIGLFIFAWTSRPSIHWIVSVIGIVIYAASGFVLFQCVFAYIPLSYPQYSASLFAGNDFLRSSFAFGSILFSRPMYLNLGVAKGVSLLGGLSVLGIFGIFYLYFNGAKLRARSKFAVS